MGENSLLSGSRKEDFDTLKYCMPKFSFDDLLNMPRFHAMSSISNGYNISNLIVKLQQPIR